MKGNLKTAKGITLIALVITIIVLLILAGVSIAMLTGQNGILTQANNAKIEQSHGTIRDSISLAYNEWQIELNTASTTKLASTEVVQIQGKEEHSFAVETDFLAWLVSKGYASSDGVINVEALTGAKQSLGNGSGTDDVYKLEQENGSYIVKYYASATEVEEIWNTSASSGTGSSEPDWDEIFENATKHPDQSETNEIIGLDSDGNPVNMDNWKTFEDTIYGGVGLGTGYGSNLSRGYVGTVNAGKIDGEIPAYVKLAGSDKGFLPVTCMDSTFESLDITECPKIPDSVVSMDSTFDYCEKLETVTNIPSNVKNMDHTFSDCIALKQVPAIPDSVTSMWGTFEGCNSLTGNLVINAQNVNNINHCLRFVAQNEGCNLVLSGSCPRLEEIFNTKSSDSNITLAQ